MRLLLAWACLWLAACSSPSASLAERLTSPGGTSPLLDQAQIAATIATVPNRSGMITARTGVALFWRAFDPGDHGLCFHYRVPDPGRDTALDLDLERVPPRPFRPLPPRGTVVLLHGWMMSGDSMLPWSLQLAQAGYRVVTIDLRNHGHSGSGPAGYGTVESDEVSDVIAALRRRGEVQGPLYLFGVSYGAATAVFTAEKLGTDVAGVVALESFANAGDAIRTMVPHMLALRPHGWQAQAMSLYARWRYGALDMDEVIAAANDRLGLDLDHVDVVRALAATRACVLVLHGDGDAHIPVSQGRRLGRASTRTHYLEVRGEDHITLPMRLDLLGTVVDTWLADEAQATAGLCPAPQLQTGLSASSR
jgi:pimeloyl-ACP methyl ester carboxylesterase